MEDASMTSENVSGAEAVESMKAVSAKAGDDHLIDELVSRAQTEGPQLTGEDGLPQQLTKRPLESPWRARSPTTSAMTSMIRRAGTEALEDRAGRLRHHLRRPALSSPPATINHLVTPFIWFWLTFGGNAL
jgi:hypothetical protein